jgi:repressor LexA
MNKLRLLQLRKEFNMTQDELCKVLNDRYSFSIDKSLISKYEKGKHEPNYYFIDLVSSVFGVTSDYMMGRTDSRYVSDHGQKKIPVIYKIPQGYPISVVSEETTEYEYVSDDSDFCVKASDDSMSGARMFTGDLVYIKSQHDVENGEIAAVTAEGLGLLIRRVLKVNGNIILHPENPSYKDAIYEKKDSKQLKILGKVRAIKAEVK